MPSIAFLPVEMWMQIISQMHKRDWIVLSTTCTLFRTIAQALIFRDVSITLNPDITGNTPGRREMILFQTALAKRPELGALIHIVSAHYQVPYPEYLQERLYRPWLSHSTTFCNLRVLNLHGCYINSDCRATLCSIDLPHLKTVSLTRCAIDPRLKGSPTGSPLGNELILKNPKSSGAWASIASEELRRLVVHTDVVGRTDHILHTISSANATQVLTVLDTDIISETLIWFLESAPQLRRLTLLPFMQRAPLSRLSTNAIPYLEHFSGPADYADVFISHRPLRSVELSLSPKAHPDILMPLRLSTAGVTKFTLFYNYSPHPRMKLILQNVPATLCHFTWKTGSHIMSESELMSWLPALYRLPNLRVLEGRLVGEYDVHTTQMAVVQTCSQSMPSLQEFVFPSLKRAGESDRWKRRRDASWEWYVSQAE